MTSEAPSHYRRKPDPPTHRDDHHAGVSAADEEQAPPRAAVPREAAAREGNRAPASSWNPHTRLLVVLVLVCLVVGGLLGVLLRAQSNNDTNNNPNNNEDSGAGVPAVSPTLVPTLEPFPSGGCSAPDERVCHFPLATRVGEHCGLSYEVFGSAANLLGTPLGTCMTNTATGFSGRWRPLDGNYLARKGVRPGSRDQTIDFRADYRPGEGGNQPNGFSLLGLYGWLEDPLVEFYVVEAWDGIRPPAIPVRLPLGEIEADGGTYEVFVTVRVDKPSIIGTQTFPQIWSVRKEPRIAGTITLADHLAGWEPQGYEIGNLYEVSFVAEAFNHRGTADVSLRFGEEEES